MAVAKLNIIFSGSYRNQSKSQKAFQGLIHSLTPSFSNVTFVVWFFQRISQSGHFIFNNYHPKNRIDNLKIYI